ncbi:MAG: ATPase [Actinobacteria bacterium]|nr:MAG: ATPase [Actinomycetota bacterium]
MPRYVITGGLGTGKTSLIAALGLTFETVAEPARELIAEHRAEAGQQSLDDRPELFVERLISRSLEKYSAAKESTLTFFDRGLPDCVAYAAVFVLDVTPAMEAASSHRYRSPVFVASPWKAIYTTDDMRNATFAQAEKFYREVVAAYEDLGYDLLELPRASVADRAAFVMARIG